MTKSAVIIGYSGHALVLADSLLSAGYNIAGYCDKYEKAINYYNLKFLGSEDEQAIMENLKAHQAFIGIGDNVLRAAVFQKLRYNNIECPSVAHASAVISVTVVLASAVQIFPGAVINAASKIGNGVICNTSSVVEHECIVGDFSHIAPGAVLAGNVHIGDRTFIGANAIIKQGVKIGSDVIVGAGCVVLKDIPNGTVVYGNPAKQK